MPLKTVADIERRMSQHDWFHEYSDDQRVAMYGMVERALIVRALAFLSGAEVIRLIEQFVPPKEQETVFIQVDRQRDHVHAVLAKVGS